MIEGDSGRLIELARQRLRRAELPRAGESPLWATSGAEQSCSLCRRLITANETTYEVEVLSDPQARAQMLSFHIACHEAWIFACGEHGSGH